MTARLDGSNLINHHGSETADIFWMLLSVIIGSIPEKMMPYQQYTKVTTEMLQYASNHKIKGYAAITTIDGLKTSLVANGPALLGIPIYNYGAHMWKQFNNESLKGIVKKDNPGLMKALAEQVDILVKAEESEEYIQAFITGFYSCYFLIKEAMTDEGLN